MSDERCGHVRERIPELVSEALDADEARALEDHLASCGPCAEERDVVAALLRSRPQPPEGLAGAIRAGLEADGDGLVADGASSGWHGPSPWWGVAAAVVAAVALGIGAGGPAASPGAPEPEVPAFAAETEEGAVWLSGDGEIAGAPLLEDLTEEALLRFLEELDAGGVA